MWVSALFSASVQTMPCKLLSETGNETGRFVCSSIANPASPYRNVRSICFFLSLWKYTVWWCWLALNSSTAKWLCKWNISEAYILAYKAFCMHFFFPLWSLNLVLKAFHKSLGFAEELTFWNELLSFWFTHEMFSQCKCCPHFYLCHPMTFPEVAQVQVVSEFEAHEAAQLVQESELSSAGSAFLLCCAVWRMQASDWIGIQVPDQFLRCSSTGSCYSDTWTQGYR